MKTEPTELNKKEPVLAVNHMVDWTDQERDITTDICYKWLKIAFREGQSNPKIKQLEWNFHGLYYDVKTAVGRYMILQGDEQYLENYITCTLTHNGSLIADFNSIEEAKSAAQKDFERRIKECLITK